MPRRHLLACVLASGLSLAAATAHAEPRLALPVACAIGDTCFVQQWPDMDGGPGAADPFCGSAAYDGHDGLDIRVRSMADVAKGVAVVAAAAGTVKGVRDALPDKLAAGAAGREAVRGVECGNGVVIDHGEGLETQYCHMRRGSVSVKSGEWVEAGQKLGEIGASGAAEFPHVHFSVRRGGEKIDPASGRAIGSGCGRGAPFAGTLFDEGAVKALSGSSTSVLGLGLAGAPVDYGALVIKGAPPVPHAGGDASLVWAWISNLRKGDTLAFRMVSPDGQTFFEGSGEPLPGNQAVYSAFAGRKRPLLPGRWTVSVEVIRDGVGVSSKRSEIEVTG
ncbi:M23 family metallopeptidase [Aureimonas sp. ME7]|uniref:M23 family metallopeptidase n=1 Tax=Aureimonas sp. ME7 TaxID=2744252 RepID=UPI0015F56047|nr:M23 family metallopeptidase [Aureimonas sp. ME7]